MTQQDRFMDALKFVLNKSHDVNANAVLNRVMEA